MERFSLAEENSIRHECRRQYRDEGSMDSPYEKGTIESLIWGSEEARIFIEREESK